MDALMLDLTADQIRLLLTVLDKEWHMLELSKGRAERRAWERQIELEEIQEKLRQALTDVPPDPRYPETIDGGTPRPKKRNPIYRGKQ